MTREQPQINKDMSIRCPCMSQHLDLAAKDHGKGWVATSDDLCAAKFHSFQ